MSSVATSFVELCGELRVQLEGRAVEGALPGRQGRLLFAYLVCNRDRPVHREELAGVLWPELAPADPEGALRAKLSKLRRALGSSVLDGRTSLTLRLPPGATVDIDVADAALQRAERALAGSDPRTAADAAAAASQVTGRGFCVGLDGPWVARRQADTEEMWVRARECQAAAALRLGGPELQTAIDAARDVIATEPLRENANLLLMTALARRGRTPDALRTYEQLRRMLREELGTVPGPALTRLHERLVRDGLATGASEAWIVVNPHTGSEWVIELDDLLLVGRDCARVDPTRRVVLDDPTVSREHLELRRSEEGIITLVDLSTNGTTVNGRHIDPGEPTAVSDGDSIDLGDARLVVRVSGKGDGGGDAARTTLRRG
jgi:DNA-binding SARP family transcriptional activator